MSERPYVERTNDRRVVWWLLVGLVVIFGGLYVAGYLFIGDKVPRNTTVAGVEVGAKTPQAAARALVDGLRGPAHAPITVIADGERSTFRPSRVGLTVDADASVAQAGGGRSWRPAAMWDFFVGGEDYDAVVKVDRPRLHRAVDAFADKVDQPATEGAVVFERGEANPTDPAPGLVLDRPAAVAAVRAAYLGADEVVALPLKKVDPEVSKAGVSAAMDAFANPAMSAPVTIELGGDDILLDPRTYSSALSMEAADGALVPRLDGARLLKALRPAMKASARAPRDAAVRLVHGRPRVIPARNGIGFVPEDVTGAFLDLVVASGRARTLVVDSVVAKPDVSTADARRLGIRQRVSAFTTYFPHADYRNTNLGRAAHLINGTVLRPGDTFSLNRVVGERTPANGFVKGFIISDGVYKEDFGGGVSQVATTTFNAAFFAGLEDVEHKPHSFYIDRYPVGREATVAWPSIDLKFKDDTSYGVLVQAWIVPSSPSREGEMHVRMWSTKVWDITAAKSARYRPTEPSTRHLHGDECVPHQGYGGFDIDVYRLFRKHGSGRLDHKERFHTTYLPSDSVVCS